MAANNKNQKSVDRILHPIMGGKVAIRDLMTDEGERGYIDFGEFDYITKKALDGLPTPTPEPPLTYEVPVTAASITINWQTDLIDGVQTYADALGNNLPKAFHYFKTADQYTRGGVEPVVNRVLGEITTVIFDWGYVADSVIVF